MDKYKWLLVILIVAQMAVYIFINPTGDFLINDEWFYARAVKDFNLTDYQFDALITPSLIGQIWYAKVITSIFGFSFEILRFSTIGLSIISVVALYLLFVELGFRKYFSFFASLLLFFNPLFFYLSIGFMTDVPALAFVIFALLFFAKYNNTKKSRYFFIACLSLIYAIIIRQSFLFLLPLSIIFVIDKKRVSAKNLFLYISSLAFFACLYFFLKSKHWWPSQDIDLHTFENASVHWLYVKKQVYSIWHYMGFFLLPISFGYLLQKNAKRKILKYILITAAFLYSAWKIFARDVFFPYFGNIISIYGLGPRDPNGVLHGSPIQIATLNEVILITVLVSLSAGIILSILVDIITGFSEKNTGSKKMIIFLALSAVSQIAVVFMFLSFDRYYLPIFLFLLIIISYFINTKKIPIINIIILLILCIPVIMLTKLSLTENRIKWQVADDLKKSGVPISDIDAGYEWLGWNWYGKTPSWRLPYWEEGTPWYISRLYPDNERVYVISHEPIIDSYKLTSKYSYGRIFDMQFNLYLHKKIYEN